jgi:CxxC-x17-CxxC domain-containing protein
MAHEFFPLSKEEAMKRGYKWQDHTYPINLPENAQTVQVKEFPSDIQQVTDDILSKILICEVTGKPFRIIKQELAFYRKHHLPLPRKHPDQRHLERMQLRTPRKLWERTCAKCGKGMQTTYSPDRPEIVYCSECYEREVQQ